jgi:hypothetical protein
MRPYTIISSVSRKPKAGQAEMDGNDADLPDLPDQTMESIPQFGNHIPQSGNQFPIQGINSSTRKSIPQSENQIILLAKRVNQLPRRGGRKGLSPISAIGKKINHPSLTRPNTSSYVS